MCEVCKADHKCGHACAQCRASRGEEDRRRCRTRCAGSGPATGSTGSTGGSTRARGGTAARTAGAAGCSRNGGRDPGAVVAHAGYDHPRESEAARERIMGRAGALEGADLEDEFLGGHRDPLDDPHFLVPLSKNRLELLSGSRRRYHRHLRARVLVTSILMNACSGPGPLPIEPIG
jgi:hypothetical protein